MPSSIQRWGNSQGLRVPKEVLAAAIPRAATSTEVPWRERGPDSLRVTRYVLRNGDLACLSTRPDHDHEQLGRHHAIVLCDDLRQGATGLCVVCPVTRTDRKHPFQVAVPPATGVDGFVLADQVRSVDGLARAAHRLDRASDTLLDEVLVIVDMVHF